MGMECLIPLFQSRTRLFCISSLSFEVILLLSEPEYDSEIFSYHFWLPATFLRLNGYTRCNERLSEGRLTDRVESRMFCDRFMELDSWSPMDGKFLE